MTTNMIKSKRGSSRRKGDDYQDLTALRLALEFYIEREPFEMFLEYEKAGNLDDIVVFRSTRIDAYQVKYAVNRLDVYLASDFTDPDSPVSFKRFADSWDKLRKGKPGYTLSAAICSNRGLEPAILDMVSQDGEFTEEVIQDRRRGDAKALRTRLHSASGLTDAKFAVFLSEFRFDVRQRDLGELEKHIRTYLLDHKLGLSDETIFFELKDAFRNSAIISHEAISLQTLDKLFERLQSKFLLPQVFPVAEDQFVQLKAFSDALDAALQSADGEYVVVTGLPGSGKSTSLTKYFDSLSSTEVEVFRYYCFVGVNDNAQRLRVQAEGLRSNLLSAFHQRYPQVLDRRFDYSERHFFDALTALANHFREEGRQLVILLDGLDHAERLGQEIRDTVISALPSDVPPGMAIVVGTQELHKWPHFLKCVRERPDRHIAMPLFSEAETSHYLIEKRGIADIESADIQNVFRKSEGLPLYLRYAAETLLLSDSPSEAISSLSPATGGDIRNYYWLLWEEFEQRGMGGARHLCAALACLRFGVYRAELFSIQASLDRPDFEDSYNCINHLLRDTDGFLSVFHNSFREFVLSQISDEWADELRRNIAEFLKEHRDTPRWFQHVFQYSHDVGDFAYVLSEVKADFIERALMHCRPTDEILDALDWAVECAFKADDIVELSRVAILKWRTNERLEYTLDRSLLADALLALGREQDVMRFAFSQEQNQWRVDEYTALAVMAKLAKVGKTELGNRLFDVFTDAFRGIQSDNRDEIRGRVVGIARCLGIFAERQARPLRWLSQFQLDPGILEQQDAYAPGYAPQLAAYIDALVRFGHTDRWKRLTRVSRIFPNSLIRFLLIRSLAHHRLFGELKEAIEKLLALKQPSGNLELAFYAARAGINAETVSAIAGPLPAPRTDCPDYLSRSDPIMLHYTYAFIVLAYEGNDASNAGMEEAIGHANTLWNATLRYLLKSCHCIGSAFRSGDLDWYSEAQECVDCLLGAEQGDGERICDSIETIRGVLPLTLGLLTQCVHDRYPDRVTDWIDKLAQLRESMLWTTHFGISESRVDYDFELRIWEVLTELPSTREALGPILEECAKTFEQATMLKGQCRSDHFLWLVSIMAKCGMRAKAETWLRYGIEASLIYGYHKDVTLLYLIDVLKLVNRCHPEHSLARCAKVLSMVQWMPHVTDGRETKWFTERAFTAVLEVDQDAAFQLLTQLAQTTSRWKMQDCLEGYVLSATGGDLEFLWCLTELFANHYSDDGRHCKQITGTRAHIVKVAQDSCCATTSQWFEARFRNFVLTEITPRHWPEPLKLEFGIADVEEEDSSSSGSRMPMPSEYTLDGVTHSLDDIEEVCKRSIVDFQVTIKKLKEQNERFYERELVDRVLDHHVAAAGSVDDLVPVKEYISEEGRFQNARFAESLAERFMEFGDEDSALTCFGIAYTCYGDWFSWRNNTKYLRAVAEKDSARAKNLLLTECYESARGSSGGYDTPRVAAAGLDSLNEQEDLLQLFNDFLQHCEAMFAQLPPDDQYSWLPEHTKSSKDLNHRILDFVIDELETPDVDHGERLVRALTDLAVRRGEIAIPVLVKRAATASRRTKRRLLQIIHSVAHRTPEALVYCEHDLVQLLDEESFFTRKTVLAVLRYLKAAGQLAESSTAACRRVERWYSSSIAHSSFRMPRAASEEFAAFLRRNTLFDFHDRMTLMDRILGVSPGSMAAAIEERLTSQGWSMEEERGNVKDDWYGHVHPQGWPVVWITTEFQETVTEFLWNILDEAASKVKLSADQLDALWMACQAVDPEYVSQRPAPRPLDIQPLGVVDKDTWLAALRTKDPLLVGADHSEIANGDWITVFEKRRLAQEEKYSVPYRQELAIESCLVPEQVYGSARELDDLEWVTERVAPAPGMAATIEETRSALLDRAANALDPAAECLPLVAEHQNPVSFLGHWSVCSLASFIVREYGLTFDGLNLHLDGKVVGWLEHWQEGYQDESYTREKLSFGMRLKVQRSFLYEVAKHYRKLICIRIHEKREHFNSLYRQNADEMRNGRRYIVVHPS